MWPGGLRARRRTRMRSGAQARSDGGQEAPPPVARSAAPVPAVPEADSEELVKARLTRVGPARAGPV